MRPCNVMQVLLFRAEQITTLIDGATVRVPVTVRAIVDAVCEYYDVDRASLLSQQQHPAIARPRQVAMHLAKVMATKNVTAIGRVIGRDHSTVRHGITVTRERMAADEQLRNDVRMITARLLERYTPQLGRAPG